MFFVSQRRPPRPTLMYTLFPDRTHFLSIPCMPLHTLESIFEEPHLQALGLFQWEDHPSEGRMRRVGVPSSWSGSQPVPGRPAPAPGQHSIEVLQEVGYSDAQIEQ